jgi:threonine dehydrogenase-like Zn-dependent dehydrogenase
MKAFVMKGIGEVGFVNKPVPAPRPTGAVVRTTKALICTSDSHTVAGGIGPRENLALGHEAVGVVHQVGSEVRDVRPGDRVVVFAITPEWGRPAAQNWRPSQSGAPLAGWKFSNTKDGVFAEYFHVNEADANIVKIPDTVADDMAVYRADILSTGFIGAENGDVPIGGIVAAFRPWPGRIDGHRWSEAAGPRPHHRG